MKNKQEEILEAFLKLKEGSLKEFKRKFGSILGPDEVTPEMEEEVRQELEADYQRVKLQPIGMDVDDEEDLTEQDRRDIAEGEESLRQHSEEVLTEFGLWKKGQKTIKESKPIRESLITEPARITYVEGGKEVKLKEVWEDVYIPENFVRKGGYRQAVAWLEKEDPDVLNNYTKEDFASVGIT